MHICLFYIYICMLKLTVVKCTYNLDVSKKFITV